MQVAQLLEFDSSLKTLKKDSEAQILGLTNFNSPKKSYLTFTKSKKLLDSLLETSSVEVLREMTLVISESLEKDIDSFEDKFLQILSSSNIDISISKLSKPFYDNKYKDINYVVDGRQMGTSKVHPTAWIAQGVFVGENSEIGENVRIHPGCIIQSNVLIGDNTEVYPNVVIYPFSKIGKSCRIHSNTTIGADGFGYNFDGSEHLKVWHVGGVEIQDDVEIGANCSVDQGTFNPTTIESGCRIDNLVQIAHNCHVGSKSIICGQSGLAGSVTLGPFCVIGGHVAIAPSVELGPGCQVGGGAKVTSSWEAKSVISGYPARPLKEWLKGQAYIRKLSLQK